MSKQQPKPPTREERIKAAKEKHEAIQKKVKAQRLDMLKKKKEQDESVIDFLDKQIKEIGGE